MTLLWFSEFSLFSCNNASLCSIHPCRSVLTATVHYMSKLQTQNYLDTASYHKIISILPAITTLFHTVTYHKIISILSHTCITKPSQYCPISQTNFNTVTYHKSNTTLSQTTTLSQYCHISQQYLHTVIYHKLINSNSKPSQMIILLIWTHLFKVYI